MLKVGLKHGMTGTEASQRECVSNRLAGSCSATASVGPGTVDSTAVCPTVSLIRSADSAGGKVKLSPWS